MTTPLRIPFCDSCGDRLPPARGRGRPRRFCSDACRKRAQRRRIYAAWAAEHPDGFCPAELESADMSDYYKPAETSDLEPVILGDAGASPDSQVLAAVSEAIALAVIFRRLGREARPQFAYRCDVTADALDKALVEWKVPR